MNCVEAVDSKIVKGSCFRIPTIEGLGSGHGFRITNLHLPVGWEEAIPVLQQLDPGNLQNAATEYCQLRGLPPAETAIDPQTGVLTEISIQTIPPSTLTLKNSPWFGDPHPKGYSETGNYSSPHEIPDLTAAITLLRFTSGFLTRIDEEIKAPQPHAFIDSCDRGRSGIWYRSVNLRLPSKFLQTEEDLFDKDYREHFYDEARNIIGRFGLESYLLIDFREKARLKYITLGYGGRDLSLNQTDGSYRSFSGSDAENHRWITDPKAAVALHGVIALYINTLLDWQERRGSERMGVSSETYIP